MNVQVYILIFLLNTYLQEVNKQFKDAFNNIYVVYNHHDVSLFVLLSIKTREFDIIMMQKLILRFHDILKTTSVKLCWIPCQEGIRGKVKKYGSAKESLNMSI
jgi:hypothetical protein